MTKPAPGPLCGCGRRCEVPFTLDGGRVWCNVCRPIAPMHPLYPLWHRLVSRVESVLVRLGIIREDCDR